jgi:hypothetical protein
MDDSTEQRRPALISAALRHLRDAEYLANSGSEHLSLDQAEHLIGFGPECARKALLSVAWVDKILGHDFGAWSQEVLAVIDSLDPSAARYDTRGWNDRYPSLADWKPSCRYNRTGAASTRALDVGQLIKQSRQAVDEAVLALWADGVLDCEEFQ